VLTNPKSVMRKFGPVCWRKVNPKPNMKKLAEVFS